MSKCPRCHQLIDSQAIACPYCKYELKAFGHPGIPLHRATKDDSLCSSCLYHEDDTCNFPQRPNAKECTLYHDRSQPLVPPTPTKKPGSFSAGISHWLQQNKIVLIVLSLLAVSLLLSLF